jgi:hypothetical protein
MQEKDGISVENFLAEGGCSTWNSAALPTLASPQRRPLQQQQRQAMFHVEHPWQRQSKAPEQSTGVKHRSKAKHILLACWSPQVLLQNPWSSMPKAPSAVFHVEHGAQPAQNVVVF